MYSRHGFFIGPFTHCTHCYHSRDESNGTAESHVLIAIGIHVNLRGSNTVIMSVMQRAMD